ncbi:Concanavalin A-like lectin/glucanase [Metarhizium guizhouense ARSEF 977]|uniref:Concanavalin A-like lectin/glucanase n=1 Tax=Metarhizium guizhouense (strain ARSEF 977) TaxID=1276136 RepID=A0A0B4IC74_METGA|nr:Concanavalin A-like lectin/glucanase [Metarhizium guizhouense ARSEF 977]
MASYALAASYAGESLLSGFNWFHGADPTHGYVSYQSRQNAEALGLYSVDEKTGVVRLGVDSTNTYPLTAGRPSIRLESKEAFNHGLFIADFLHMPPSQCGVWPAFWSYGPNWPASGEVDIIEGANDQHNNLMSAHTAPGCTISKSLGGKFSGAQRETDCNVGNNNVGCGYSSPAGDTSAYGDGFNAANGGVYAMEWDNEFIKIWHFARSEIPKDITNKTPDTKGWGAPDAVFGGGDCNVDNFFKDMSLVININFCGDWGNAIWGKSDGCGKYAATCNEYVANNPKAFANAYWDVRYIETYQKTDVRTSSSSPSASATEPLTRVTRTTSITTTITIRRPHRTTRTVVEGRNTTSVLGVDATSSYQSVPEVVATDTTPVYGVNATSSYESTPEKATAGTTLIYRANTTSSHEPTSEEATAGTTAPVYRVNVTSSYVSTTEEAATSITPVYRLNTTSSLWSSHSSRSANTTDAQLYATSSLRSTRRSIPTNGTAVPRHTTSSLVSVPSGTITNTSQALRPQAASSPVSIPSEVPAPKNPVQLGDFAYLGCYGSSDDFKSFRKVKDSKDMTIDLCVQLCRDSMFSGVYDTQCFCADSIDADTRAANTKNGDVCDHPCPGNDVQYCGGLAKSPERLANTTSTPANDRFENIASSTGVAASKSTATGQRFRNSTTGGAGNSTLATRFHVPSKRSPLSRMKKAILLTVYGVVKDETPPPPPPSMAGNNITHTFTAYSTTVRVKTITVIPVQATAGASKADMVADKSPSGPPVADETVVSTQVTSVPSENKPVGDKDHGKTIPTGENSDPEKDGFAPDRQPGSSYAGDKTVDRVLETAAPSNVEFVTDKRPDGSPVGGKTVTKTVDQMEVVVEDCGCTEGETRPTCTPHPSPPPSAEKPNPPHAVPSDVEVPVPAEASKHSQPAPPAQATNARQPVPSDIEVPVPVEGLKNSQPAPPPAQATNNPHQSAPSDIEAPVLAQDPKHTQPAPPPAQNTKADGPEFSGNDSPAPVGSPGEIQHALPSPAPPPPAQITHPYRVRPSGFETLPPAEASHEAKTPKPAVVTAGTGKTWSEKPGVMLGLITLVVAMLL